MNGGIRARLPHLPVTLAATGVLLVFGVLVGWAIWGGVGANLGRDGTAGERGLLHDDHSVVGELTFRPTSMSRAPR